MCNNCNWSNRSSCGCGCGCGCNQCGCNQCSLFNTLFGSSQSVCRDCCGNLVVRNGNGCGNARNSCGCGCGSWNNTASANTSNGNGNNGFACVSYCQRVNDNATAYSGCNSTYNETGYGRCGCNAYSAWTQENYGE